MQARKTRKPKTDGSVIREIKQLQCLTNALRQSVYDAIGGIGSASAIEIGDQLGQPADVVNYHLKKLQETGLVTQDGLRGEGRSAARLFRKSDPEASVLLDPSDTNNVELLAKAVGSMLTLAHKDVTGALESGVAVTVGPKRNLRASRHCVWLTDEEWERVNLLLEELLVLSNKGSRREGDEKLYAISLVTAPVPVKPVRRAR